MRVYPNLELALSELRRDLYKSPVIEVQGVQQNTDLELVAHEALGYQFMIKSGGVPTEPIDLLDLVFEQQGFTLWKETKTATLINWLEEELDRRMNPERLQMEPSESLHPALATTIEGRHPSYTYQERLQGMWTSIPEILIKNSDSRRAYWPIFQPQDSRRASWPTRVPCSLGYHFLIREIDGIKYLNLVYNMRSSDFETFLPSDIWFADRIKTKMADLVDVHAGHLILSISSFHSFAVNDQVVY